MKQPSKSRTKKPPRKTLPATLSGQEMDDLLWDYASPLASAIFEDLEARPPAPEFWTTVSGAAVFSASDWAAKAAKHSYKRTSAPVLRRLRKRTWRHRRKLAIEDAMLLWGALLAQQAILFPGASHGQLWVLIRDALRVLFDELRLVEADGH